MLRLEHEEYRERESKLAERDLELLEELKLGDLRLEDLRLELQPDSKLELDPERRRESNSVPESHAARERASVARANGGGTP